MKISTIVATLNAAPTLQRAIDSFNAQTHADKELLIADGGSTDGTIETILLNQPLVSWWRSGPDSGLFDAWNRAIVNARGDWIHMLGADDFYLNDSVLSRVSAVLEQCSPTALVAYGTIHRVTKDGALCEKLGSDWDANRFRTVAMTIPHQGVFHHRSLFEQYGLFSTSDRATQTYEMLLRYLKDHDAHFMPGLEIAAMEVFGMSSNPKNMLRFYKAYIQAQRKHGTFAMNPELAYRIAQAYAKRLLFGVLPESHGRGLLNLARWLTGRRAIY